MSRERDDLLAQSLLAWLCILRYNFAMGVQTFFVPKDVIDHLVALGLLADRCDINRNGDAGVSLRLTDDGMALADLNAGDFGIDAMMLSQADSQTD